MWICEGCGAWLEATALAPTAAGMTIACPACDYREPFVQEPLWWITGSPGSGKSSLIPHLRRALPEWFIFDGEAVDFWRFREGDSYTALYDQWLKVGHQVALNGRPLLIVATALPAQIDACPCRAYFAAIHFLGLVCPAAEQEHRLRARPAWRQSDDPATDRQRLRIHAHPRSARARAAPGTDAARHHRNDPCGERDDRCALGARQRATGGALKTT